MQATPVRLSQALWTAFQAAKPIHRQIPRQYSQCAQRSLLDSTRPTWYKQTIEVPFRSCRAYSDKPNAGDLEKKVEDAKQRIDQSLDSRADIAQGSEPVLKQHRDETIVHTMPEASSIVYTKENDAGAPKSTKPNQEKTTKQDPKADWTSSSKKYAEHYAEWASSRWQSSPLPSQIADLRSRATKRFTAFMDNLQGNIVVAAHHINDLTGYSGIERLKQEIEAQETAVQDARKNVKDSRERYSTAIATRSDTQREVNDLLQRKHAWSPTDLERFTTLYRSDHANEQSEQKAHQDLSQAELQYEETSTRLAKSILARYHEEQIWSDKIRQMSTWGTWGLMGLNVLLFIVFQILVEPWRRKRLVRGFEEKVQAALDEKEKLTDEKFASIRAERNGNQIVQEAVQQQPEIVVATAAESIAEAIADAVTGATESFEERSNVPDTQEIESVAQEITQQELANEVLQPANYTDTPDSLSSSLSTIDIEEPHLISEPDNTTSTTPSIFTDQPSPLSSHPPEPQTWQSILNSRYTEFLSTATQTLQHYRAAILHRFNDTDHVVLSQRELTARVFEGVFAGVALTCSVAFIFARGRA